MADKNYSRIEDIKSSLYNRKNVDSLNQLEGKLHNIQYKVDEDWSKEDKEDRDKEEIKMKKKKTPVFKIFFIGSIIFFIIALSFAFYKFSNNGTLVSNKNIDITILGNAFTKGGEDLPLQIEITNKNNAKLELANLLISYPSGASNDIADIIRLPRNSIGTIEPGQTIIRNVKVKLFGEEKSIRDITFSLEYHPEGSNAIFTKIKKYPVTISSAPLSLYINAPNTITSDQDFSFEVKAVLNSSLPGGSPTILQISYPNNFVFESSTPEATFSNTTWNLSNLSVTNPVAITIKGRLVGQNGDEQVFHAYVGKSDTNNQSVVGIVYNSLLHSIIIKKPFLSAKILVNSQDLPSFTAFPGDNIPVQISWQNNLPTLITNAQIIVSLSGNVLDKSNVNSGSGFYDSSNNQIIWDKNTTSQLASIEPGGTGTLNFKIKSISLIGNLTSIKDPQIEINVSIKGIQPNSGSALKGINNFSKKIIKILSNFQIASSASYASGALPPKAEKETKYVVVWTLSNTSNIITGARAQSILPIYVNWVGPLTGGNENISYNKITREVIWNIGLVNPNVGFSSNREASFMISLNPSLSQVQSVPQLMKKVFLTGTDSFAGVPIKSGYRAITTMLPNDPSFKQGDQQVVK